MASASPPEPGSGWLECECPYCVQERRKERNKTIAKEVLKFAAGLVITTVAVEAAVLAAPALLGAAGFTGAGIRATSIAARCQSWLGNVQKASVFARLMSMGAKGALTPGVISALRTAGQCVYFGGSAVAHLLEKDEQGNFRLPEDPHCIENLQNELIELGLLCPQCMKRIDWAKSGLCESVCAGHHLPLRRPRR